MSHSIGSKLSSLRHKELITDTEYVRLKKALNSLRVDEMYQLEMEQAEEFISKSVLNKIRAEIEDLRFGQPLRKLVVDECLEIIDKYKSDKEGD